MGELSEAEKEVFKNAGARRKAAGIRLGKVSFMADTNQVVSFNDFWSGWIEALGKQKAVDYLLVVMAKADENLRRAIARRT